MDSRCEARKTSPAGRKLLKTTEKYTLLVLKSFLDIAFSFLFVTQLLSTEICKETVLL